MIQKFDELIALEYFSANPNEGELERILETACRVENWTKPWEGAEDRLTFRAKLIGSSHPEYSSDTGGENSPATEQAYRRGYVQGFSRVLDHLKISLDSDDPLAKELHRAWKWRSAKMHSRELSGVFEEPDYPCRIRSTLRRSGVAPRIRWLVLERDGRKCVVCGASAAEGVVLEVNHVVTVARGGSDAVNNLQTLCFDCNRGKADLSGDS